MSIVLTGIAIFTGMGMAWGPGMIESTKRGATYRKLDGLEDILMAYRTAYNRLPCPADPSLAPGNAGYGQEAGSAGDCSGGAVRIDSSKRVAEGAIPFRQLGIPESFMYDGWDRKIAYAVGQAVTTANVMTGQSLTDRCGVHVTDAGGVAGNRTSGAVYALVSFGPDGHGGYLRGGSRMNAGVTNADELTNCHCDSSATATAYAASYVEKDTSLDASDAIHPFGDLVRFKERWQMMTTDDMYATGGSPVCSHGLRIDGSVADLGRRDVAFAAGDINGDGISDLVLAFTYGDGIGCGTAYVVFGTKTGFPDPLPLNALNGSNGFRIEMPYPTCFGGLVAAAGDVNGDGVADLVLGAPHFAPGNQNAAGSAFVVFGRECGGTWGTACPASYTVNTSLMNGTTGTEFDGPAAGAGAGGAVAVGDVNGDGKADLIIGAGTASPGGVTQAGSVYVVFGHAGAWGASTVGGGGNMVGATLNGGVIDGTHGIEFDGVNAYGTAGGEGSNTQGSQHELAVGDVNGDGKPDLIIGAPTDDWSCASPCYGRVYVVYGGSTKKDGTSWAATQPLDGGLLNGIDGVTLQGNGSARADRFGSALAVGDVNGDGIADLVIGAPYARALGLSAGGPGMTYVLFGATSGWTTTASTSLTDAYMNGTNGASFAGATNDGLFLGKSVAVGDVDGDGIADVVIGEPGYPAGTGAGAAYLVFGKGSGWPASPAPLPGTYIDGTDGVELDGPTANDLAGSAVAAVDLDAGGIPDIIVGAPGASPGGLGGAGSTYVIYGHTNTGGHWQRLTPFDLGNL